MTQSGTHPPPGAQPPAAPDTKKDAKTAKDPNAPVALCPTCGQPMPDKPVHFEEYPKMLYKQVPKPAAPVTGTLTVTGVPAGKASDIQVKVDPGAEEEETQTKVVKDKEEEDKAAGEGFSDKPPEPKKPSESSKQDGSKTGDSKNVPHGTKPEPASSQQEHKK